MIKTRNPDSHIVKITLLAAGLMAVLGGAPMAPALPGIGDHFAGLDNIETLTRLVLTLPALLIALTATAAGVLVDRLGRLRVLISSVALAGIAGTSSFFAVTLGQVLAGRALLGVGVAGIMTSGTTLIADYYEGPERARLLGLQTGLMGIGGTVLLMVTGVLADIRWNAPFLIHLAAFGVLPFAALYLFEPQRQDRCTDDHPPVGEPGACAGEAEIRERPPSPPPAAEPVPYRLLAFIYLLVIFIQVNFYLVPLYLPYHLADLVGATATRSGIAISFLSLSFALSSIFLGRTLARRDRIAVLTGAFAVLAVGYGVVALGAATPWLYPGLVLGGIGLGILVPSLYVWAAEAAPVAMRGRVLGGFTTTVFLGQFLSPVLSQPLIAAYEIGRTLLIASGIILLIIPVLFAGRRTLRQLGAAAG
jgi:MFS family permease